MLLVKRSLTYVAPDMQVFNQAKAVGKEVFDMIHRKPLISYNSDGKTAVLQKIEGGIDMYDVHFAYQSRQDKLILQGFSLSIPAGKTIALVGSSGCGKRTIISLAESFSGQQWLYNTRLTISSARTLHAV